MFDDRAIDGQLWDTTKHGRIVPVYSFGDLPSNRYPEAGCARVARGRRIPLLQAAQVNTRLSLVRKRRLSMMISFTWSSPLMYEAAN